MTSKAQTLLREAAKELKLADRQQGLADKHKWAAAERMWKANKEEGVNTREIGSAVGVSHSTAQFHIRIWAQYGLETAASKRPSFTDAYYELRNESPEAREDRAVERVARERPEVIASALTRNPKAAAKAAPAVVKAAPAAVAKAAASSEAEKIADEEARQKKDSPATVHRLGFSEVIGDLYKVKRGYASALETIRDLDLDDEEKGAVMEVVKEIDLVREWFVGFLESGSADFDSELEKLLNS